MPPKNNFSRLMGLMKNQYNNYNQKAQSGLVQPEDAFKIRKHPVVDKIDTRLLRPKKPTGF